MVCLRYVVVFSFKFFFIYFQASTSAYNYQGINYPFYDYPQNDDTYRSIQTRRIDFNRDRSPLALIRDPDYEARTNKRPVQRTNERSIAVDSGVQRVQENEKKRVQSRIEDNVNRSENGSYKIVNNYSLLPTISSRRGKLVRRTEIQLASWIQILATLLQ